jgi:hypothetical protein
MSNQKAVRGFLIGLHARFLIYIVHRQKNIRTGYSAIENMMGSSISGCGRLAIEHHTFKLYFFMMFLLAANGIRLLIKTGYSSSHIIRIFIATIYIHKNIQIMTIY